MAMASPAFAAQPAIPLQELLDLLKTNLPGVSVTDLDQLTTDGLLRQLGGRVRLARQPVSPGATNQPTIATNALHDREIGHIRIGRVDEELPEALSSSWQQLVSSNRVAALVVDLRNASGESLAAAAKTADLFLNHEKAIFKAGEQTFSATKSEKDISVPIAILVNGQTRGAAEALAGALRVGRSALVFGSRTAGEVRNFQGHKLPSGAQVEIASGWIEFPNGQTIRETGLEPDLVLEVAPELEKSYLENPFWATVDHTQAIDGARGSNTVSRRLINEAELVRRQRGEQLTPDPGQDPLPSKPVVADPVLARGLDFLKGVLVFHKEAGDR